MADRLRPDIAPLLELHVLRNVDDDGTGPSGRRDLESLVHDPGEIVGILHQPVMLGTGPRDADRIAFLEGVVADEMRRHLPRQHDQGNGIHQRIGEAGDRIRRAGTGGDEHDSGLAGGAGIAFRGMNRTLLVADEDVLDVVLLEDRVVDRKDRAAGIAENMFHALVPERADDDLRSAQFQRASFWHQSATVPVHDTPSGGLKSERGVAAPCSYAAVWVRGFILARPAARQ